MATIIKMVQNDTAPSRVFQITRSGAAVNVTGATVKFKIKDQTSGTVTNASHQSCVLTTPTSGIVTYTFAAGDLPDAGAYTCELEITYADTTIETVPNIIISATAEVA